MKALIKQTMLIAVVALSLISMPSYSNYVWHRSTTHCSGGVCHHYQSTQRCGANGCHYHWRARTW